MEAGGLGNMANRCDGDQLVVGACGGGFNSDCPDGAFTLVECCRMPEFYYGSCEVHGGTWGELLQCPEIHTDAGHLVEGFCESGSSYACNGHASRSSAVRVIIRDRLWAALVSVPGYLVEDLGLL